ncbi:response regulator [Niveispirillum sp. KHB5.9]|uniref:response regulator n=1 Tax=Niveispirillum sp. KHB5.9 TaxID=3400269 RepID=UPI003A8B60A0
MILIVEDSEEQRIILSAIITHSNLGPAQAVASAEDALQLLEIDRASGPASDVRAILMDVMLPGIDGISAAAQIHANPRLTNIPLIVISALEESESLAAAFAAGATDYIVKPVAPVALAARLRTALRPPAGARLKSVDCRQALDGIFVRGVRLDVSLPDWPELKLELGQHGADEIRDKLIEVFSSVNDRADKWVCRGEGGRFSLLVEGAENGSGLMALAAEIAAEMPWPHMDVTLSSVGAA